MQQPQRRSQTFAQFLPHSSEEIPQAYSLFEKMRTQQPVFHSEQLPLWQACDYEGVKEVINDYSRFSSHAIPGFSDSFLTDTLVVKDQPDHRNLSNLLNQALT